MTNYKLEYFTSLGFGGGGGAAATAGVGGCGCACCGAGGVSHQRYRFFRDIEYFNELIFS